MNPSTEKVGLVNKSATKPSKDVKNVEVFQFFWLLSTRLIESTQVLPAFKTTKIGSHNQSLEQSFGTSGTQVRFGTV